VRWPRSAGGAAQGVTEGARFAERALVAGRETTDRVANNRDGRQMEITRHFPSL